MIGAIIFGGIHTGLLLGLLGFGIALPIVDAVRNRREIHTTAAKR